MSESNSFIAIVFIIALCCAMLAWFAIEMGSKAWVAYKNTFTEKTKFQAKEFFLFIDPTQLFLFNIVLIVILSFLVWVFTSSLFLCILVAVLLGFSPQYIYKILRKKRLEKFERQLPDALLMLSGGMRAGVGITSAIQQLVKEAESPLSQEFSLMLREQRLGVTVEQSLSNLNRRVPMQTTTLVVSAMKIANETGGSLAETLERTSKTIRARLQSEGKIKALTAQGKLQAWVVGLLPIALMVILNEMEPEAMSMLWNTPIGWVTLIVIAFLEIMGIYLIRKIVSIDV